MNRLNPDTSADRPGLSDTTGQALADATWRSLLDAAHHAVPPADTLPAVAALYSPLLATRTDRPFVYAHLAQSLDGRIALHCGASQWISGPADLDHTHRLRALADAVLVGAHTVAADNPRLTVRRVPGPSPQRVVLDPSLRLGPDHLVFQDAGAWRICREDAPGTAGVRLPATGSELAPADILGALHARGIRRLFIEGGAVTISRFLAAGCIDRLHLVVAPVFLGSGRPSVQLDDIRSIGDALRPQVAVHSIGDDTLYDCIFGE